VLFIVTLTAVTPRLGLVQYLRWWRIRISNLGGRNDPRRIQTEASPARLSSLSIFISAFCT